MTLLPRLFYTLSFLIALSLTGHSLAHSSNTDHSLSIHLWAPPSWEGAKVGVAYGTITNTAKEADTLISASSSVSNVVELHSHEMDAGVMKMKKIESIAIPAGGKVALQQGGLHLMLIDLKQPLSEGKSFPVELVFEKAGRITADVLVEKFEQKHQHSH